MIYKGEKYEELILTCDDVKTNETTTVYPQNQNKVVYSEVSTERNRDEKDAEIALGINSNYANFHDVVNWNDRDQDPFLSQGKVFKSPPLVQWAKKRAIIEKSSAN